MSSAGPAETEKIGTAGTGRNGTAGTGKTATAGTERIGTVATGTTATAYGTAETRNGRSQRLRPFLLRQTWSQTVVSTGSSPFGRGSLLSRIVS